MSEFKMVVSFEGEKILDTDDLLTALKISSNYEADLYKNGRLIHSPLGLPHEENERLLNENGITVFVKNGCLNYKYTDESLNNQTLYADFMMYEWDNQEKLQVMVHDYKENKYCEPFDNLEEIKEHIKETFKKHYILGNVHLLTWINGDHEAVEL